MPTVTIDGVEYEPAGSGGASIGIAITTHDRPDTLAQAIEHHLEYLPSGARLFVIDDNSSTAATVPAGVEHVILGGSDGIVAAKNASLAALVDAGVKHLFLWDDDAWPIADGWHLPYIASAEPHLSYQFLDLSGPRKLRDIAILHRDGEHVAYTGQRGVMLYYDRSVIEKVGGFDPVYGRGMYEHSDLANRIYHAGLTSWRYADVAGSEKLIYSLDEHEKVERSVPRQDREQLVKLNAETHNHRRDTGEFPAFVPYRKPRNVVITTLLTSETDPQRGKKWDADSAVLSAWASSIKGGTRSSSPTSYRPRQRALSW